MPGHFNPGYGGGAPGGGAGGGGRQIYVANVCSTPVRVNMMDKS
jgi:hypothetical protein